MYPNVSDNPILNADNARPLTTTAAIKPHINLLPSLIAASSATSCREKSEEPRIVGLEPAHVGLPIQPFLNLSTCTGRHSCRSCNKSAALLPRQHQCGLSPGVGGQTRSWTRCDAPHFQIGIFHLCRRLEYRPGSPLIQH